MTKSGTGTGTVAGGAINCGTTCTAPVTAGATVTLTATAASGSTFGGWGGACASATGATCTVTMSQARSVSATFTINNTGTAPCASPVTFSWNTGNFNTTGAVCYRVQSKVNGWNCSNMAGRTVSVNGGTASTTCGGGALGQYTDGYTYFSVSAGQYAWASISVW